VIFNARVATALPAQDLDRAKKFYEETFDITPAMSTPDGSAMYMVEGGTGFFVFKTSGKPSGDHTQMAFAVDDVDKAVDLMIERGVTFEQYDMPGLKTDERGVTDLDGEKGAFFKDPEGNLIALNEMPEGMG
jgi:predicted enzyme related to lactoylglutathione lyase